MFSKGIPASILDLEIACFLPCGSASFPCLALATVGTSRCYGCIQPGDIGPPGTLCFWRMWLGGGWRPENYTVGEIEVSRLDQTRDGSRVSYPNGQRLSGVVWASTFFLFRGWSLQQFVCRRCLEPTGVPERGWFRRMQTLGVGSSFRSQQGQVKSSSTLELSPDYLATSGRGVGLELGVEGRVTC